MSGQHRQHGPGPADAPRPAPARRRRGAGLALPLLGAGVLSLLTHLAGPWQDGVAALPKRPADGIFAFAPSGNEWRLERFSRFATDGYTLERTCTFDGRVAPLDDARAAMAGRRECPPELLRPHPRGDEWTRRSLAAWGWPLRHSTRDQFGRRGTRPGALAVDTLALTPVWLAVMYAVRAPVAAIARRLTVPAWACRACRYDLRGLPEDAPCPECGRARRGRTPPVEAPGP